jgi:hypothetical protein
VSGQACHGGHYDHMRATEKIAHVQATAAIFAELGDAVKIGVADQVGKRPENPELWVLGGWLSSWRPDVAAEFIACQQDKAARAVVQEAEWVLEDLEDGAS